MPSTPTVKFTPDVPSADERVATIVNAIAFELERITLPAARVVSAPGPLAERVRALWDAHLVALGDASAARRSQSHEVMETLYAQARRLDETLGPLLDAPESDDFDLVEVGGDGRAAMHYLAIVGCAAQLVGLRPMRADATPRALRDEIKRRADLLVPSTRGDKAKGKAEWGLPWTPEDIRAVHAAIKALLVQARAAGVAVLPAWGAGTGLPPKTRAPRLRGEAPPPTPHAVAWQIVAARLGLTRKVLDAKLARRPYLT